MAVLQRCYHAFVASRACIGVHVVLLRGVCVVRSDGVGGGMVEPDKDNGD